MHFSSASLSSQRIPKSFKLYGLFSVVFATLLILSSCASGPVITTFTPEFGTTATQVTINGERLVNVDTATTQIDINGVEQKKTDVQSSQVTFVIAPGTTTGPIQLTTPDGVATSTDVFEVAASLPDTSGGYTFGGVESVMGIKVTPSEIDQEVVLGLLRPRWIQEARSFADLQPLADTAFNRMNEFWLESSFGKASFKDVYLEEIIDLPQSVDYYYHGFKQRNIKGWSVSEPITLTQEQSLTIESNGQKITTVFPTGTYSLSDIEQRVATAVAAADPNQAPPSFTFASSGSHFTISTTLPGKRKAILEVYGTMQHHLGFGNATLFRLGDNAPALIRFGKPITNPVSFTSEATLTIRTLGQVTDVSFPSGSYTLEQLVSRIKNAYPGEDQQQPFKVELRTNALSQDQKFLVFMTHVDDNGDHGYRLTLSGSAANTLGLSEGGMIQRYEPETFRGHLAIKDGFDIYAASLPGATDVEQKFGSARMFVGLMVTDEYYRASYSSWEFDLQGKKFNVSYFTDYISNPSIGPVFAHEAGHALGLPDLYKTNADQVGTVPDNWDVMDCSFCDAHPTGWLKSFGDNDPTKRVDAWLKDGNITEIRPPARGGTNTKRVILTPVESPWISSNPFASGYPGVEVAHAVRLVPTDERDAFFLENRQSGVYQADHLGTPINFSKELPTQGVIVYRARRLDGGGLPAFLPVSLLTPYSNPLNNVGETYEQVITNTNRITFEITDKLINPDNSSGRPSYSYLTEITWGQGSFYDLAITPWDPAPWESSDIWVDSRAENDWGVYTYKDAQGEPILNGDNIAVGEENRIYARVHNLGDVDVTQPVTVIWSIAVPQVAGGELKTELGRVTIPVDRSTGISIPAKSSVVTPPQKYVPSNSNEEHICVKAEIVSLPGELNGSLNNSAQENLTQWFTQASSPFSVVSIPLNVSNPYDDRDADILLNVPEIPQGWTVSVDDVSFRLVSGGTKQVEVKVQPILSYFEKQGDFKERGYINDLPVNIEAQVIYGDVWRSYGGTTAVVNPVNKDSRIELEAPNKTTLRGKLSTSGPMRPPLGNRSVHLRFRTASGKESWQRLTTTANGEFTLTIPTNAKQESTGVRAFTPGRRGFAPAASNEVFIGATFSPEGMLDGMKRSGSTQFAEWLQSSELLYELDTNKNYTFVVPSDEAVEMMSDELREEIENNRNQQLSFLSSHILEGRKMLRDMISTKSITTIRGKTFPVATSAGRTTIGSAQVIDADKLIGSSVLHVVSHPLE